MKTKPSIKQERGLTLVELLVVTVIIGFFALIVLSLRGSGSGMARARAGPRIRCVNNLRLIGLAYYNWASDHGDDYPMAVSETNGGSMEFITGLNAFHHFQAISNKLSTPMILICPAESDRKRFAGTNFNLSNSNLSFFVGIDAKKSWPEMILSGDHNITNGTPVKNGVLGLTTNTAAAWTAELHNKVGNLLLADGSVQQVSSSALWTNIANTGVQSNRLQMP